MLGGVLIKKERTLAGLLLIGAGLFLFLQHWHVFTHNKWLEWPELLLIFGLCFFVFGWMAPEWDLLFPAFLLIGFGAHPFLTEILPMWARAETYYPLLMGIGFLIRYYKVKKNGLSLGIILIVFALFPLFSHRLNGQLLHKVGSLSQYWPLIIIIIGLIFFYKKK
ncbi:hypothetical protein PU629_06610 [Pullulanibacillus sp. KACC 23026]|uniref:hypothetical protein n=1 Tax=Pullulanibacillus sp. KACC 23026 TaxID=3028315 RepID=UPI0023B101B1|nr:hypothetical protein [Pullulanibacillus sp. KACC 23026]WEG14035.1 hypothetical protein PU629_06610 [Pullulanibacillus sp. KACC 23026]